jgi:uncharacterized membrane protein YdjX (TVP38/TMEM64 family)
VFGLVWGILDPQHYGQYRETAQRMILPLGVWGMAVFVLLQAAQVVITPVSHYVVGAIGGFLYGPILGGVLNYTGRMIGHALAFLIAHKARPRAEKWVGAETMQRYDAIFSGDDAAKPGIRLQHVLLFLVFFLPLFPDDEVSYLVGLSRMRWVPFLLANLFGQLGGAFSLAYIGAGIDTTDWLFWALSGATLAGFLGLWAAFVVLRHKRKAAGAQ